MAHALRRHNWTLVARPIGPWSYAGGGGVRGPAVGTNERCASIPPPRRTQRHRIRIERSLAGPSKPAEGCNVSIMPAVPPPAASTS